MDAPISTYRPEQAQRLGAWLIVTAGLALAVWWAVRAVLLLVNPASGWVPVPPPPPAPAATVRDLPTFDFAFDPFNRDAPTSDAPITVPDPGADAPETTLNLKLVGRRALMGEDVSGGSATIRRPDGTEGNFYVDDEVVPGVILRSITPDFVVLARGERLERLTFERETAGLGAAPATTAPEDVMAPTQLSPSLTLEDFLRAAKLTPVSGNQRGVRVTANPGADLSQFGLRSGDIATRIGSADLTTGLPDMSDLIDEMNTRNSVEVRVIRNGQPLTLTIGR